MLHFATKKQSLYACLVVNPPCCDPAWTCTPTTDVLANCCSLTVSPFRKGNIAGEVLPFDDSPTERAVPEKQSG